MSGRYEHIGQAAQREAVKALDRTDLMGAVHQMVTKFGSPKMAQREIAPGRNSGVLPFCATAGHSTHGHDPAGESKLLRDASLFQNRVGGMAG